MKKNTTAIETGILRDSFNISSYTDHGGDELEVIASFTPSTPSMPSQAEFDTNPLVDLNAIESELQQNPNSCVVLRGACIEVGHFLETHHRKLFENINACRATVRQLRGADLNFGILTELLCNAAKHGQATDHADRRAAYFGEGVKEAQCLSMERVTKVSITADGKPTNDTQLEAKIRLLRADGENERDEFLIYRNSDIYAFLTCSISLIRNYIRNQQITSE